MLEDLDISTLKLLPGHLYVRNITDIDISAADSGETDTAVGAMTHIHAKGLQVELKEVSFYFKDKTATVGPSEITGILELGIPPQGLDVDLKVRLLPNTAKGLAERERIKGFHQVEKVEVNVSDGVTLDIKESNHSILVTMFKPVMLAGFRRTLAKTLSEQLEAAIVFADGVAWDIGCVFSHPCAGLEQMLTLMNSERAVVFQDTGLPRSASLVAAMWSEIGRFSRGQSSRGLTSGWTTTATGIVKDDPAGASFAMGAEPQILSPEQHGPKARLAEPLADKAQRAADAAGVDVDMEDATATAQGAKEQAQGIVQEGVKQVKGFKATIDRKREAEVRSDGWKSSAFDS